MPTCSIKWCGKTSTTSNYKKDGITFHRFPKCPEKKQKWMEATCRADKWFPTSNSVICSRHFSEDNFHIMKERRRLMDSAVPTLFLPVLVNLNAGEGSSSSKTSTKKRRLDDDSDECEENLSDIEDEYDVWAKECAIELRQMDPEQQIFAKSAIAFILRAGRMRLLCKNSVQINNEVQVEQITKECSSESSLGEFLVIREKDAGSSSVATCQEIVEPSRSQPPVDTGSLVSSASNKTGVRSRAKSKSSNKPGDLSLVTASHKTASSFGSPSDNTGLNFTVESHKTVVQTKPFDGESSSGVTYQEIVTPDGSSSIPIKLESFDDSESRLHEITAPVSSPLLVKLEPCDDTGSISLSASHQSIVPVKRSPSIVNSEPNSPPSSPGFTVIIKSEPE